MRDEMEGRLWVAHHADFTAEIGKFLKSIGFGFCRLTQRQFDAPWRTGRKSTC